MPREQKPRVYSRNQQTITSGQNYPNNPHNLTFTNKREETCHNPKHLIKKIPHIPPCSRKKIFNLSVFMNIGAKLALKNKKKESARKASSTTPTKPYTTLYAPAWRQNPPKKKDSMIPQTAFISKLKIPPQQPDTITLKNRVSPITNAKTPQQLVSGDQPPKIMKLTEDR